MSPTLLRLTRLKERLKIPGTLTASGGSVSDQGNQQEYFLNLIPLAKGCPGARRELKKIAGVKGKDSVK